jgi:phosphatidylglycerophosphate synthase
LSFSRLPLAVAFLTLVSRPRWALAVLLAAGVTDVLDGYLARRLGQATPTGAVIDGVLDKLFAAIVIGGLAVRGALTWLEAVLLATRELGELPLVIWWVIHEDGGRGRAEDPRANWSGKAATVCQFVAIASISFGGELSSAWLASTALAGAASAVFYWWRELHGTSARTEAGAR